VTEDEEVLFADSLNHRVRKIDHSGIIITIAGNGIFGYNGDGELAIKAQLRCPSGVFQYKNEIYITDYASNRVRKIDRISTIARDENIISPHSIFIHKDEVYFTN